MAVQASTTDVTATVTLWVPLGASGDLTSGVESVLDGVQGVEAPAVYDVLEVQPRSTDIQVTAVVGVRVEGPADADRTRVAQARDRLADGFGVMSVDRCSADADAEA